MKRFITLDDFTETYAKLHQRGLGFVLSKFTTNETKRAKTAFNHFNISGSHWHLIPKIKERWRNMVTSNKDITLEDFTVKTFLEDRKNLKMLSLGSGNCSSEIAFAKHDNFNLILCTDIAEKRLKIGRENAEANGLSNIKFQTIDVNHLQLEHQKFDIIYFRASLHHFKNVEQLVSKTLPQLLNPDGILIINEYVGPTRLQLPKHQIKAINKGLNLIPKPYRKRFKLNLYKNKVYGPGLWRMILADPSECIDSASIMPSIHKNYDTIYEASYGGNILQFALKDIAHHFIELNKEKALVLENLFKFEDQYLKENTSDFIFGLYKLKTNT